MEVLIFFAICAKCRETSGIKANVCQKEPTSELRVANALLSLKGKDRDGGGAGFFTTQSEFSIEINFELYAPSRDWFIR
jgi:ribosomal protein L40E